MLAKTVSKVRFFAIFLACSFLQSQSNFIAQPNLWHQIIPLIGNTNILKAQTAEEKLKACTAQAILLNGKSYEILEKEMLQTMQSLHLFSHVLPKISSNNLRLGYFSFAKNICQVTDDLDILRTKTAYNTYLHNNPQVAQELDQILQSLKLSESDFMMNFYSKPPKQTHEPVNFVEEGFSILETIEKKIFSNRYIGEVYKRLNQITSLAFLYASAVTLCGWSTKIINDEQTYNFKPLNYISNNFFNKNVTIITRSQNPQEKTTYNIKDYHAKQIDNLASFWKPVFNLFTDEDSAKKHAQNFANIPTMSIPITTMAVLGTVLFAASTATGLKKSFDDSYQKNQSLLLLKELIKTCQKIVKTVIKNPELEQFLSEYPIIKQFADYKTHKKQLGTKMVHLIGLLNYYPFNSQPRYYISWQGKIHETFLLYEEIHHEFMPLWQALAEIDAQLCIHKLLNHESNVFCIPQWINQEKPLLDVQGYWHPMISYQKAIVNNMTLGTSNVAGNTIITGANAGGKTTAMTALMLCTILSQSIGIVPAQAYKATPFARMHTYLDITTNLAENESLFMAQANRAKHLYESIKNCKPHEKTFTILDEIFTGTRADFAEKASYQFAKILAELPHSMCIIATHFPKLTELEKTNLFVNYQAAAAIINDDGSLTYPYLIIPGISTQNIADHILKNKGILTS